jgi:prevent-host-death family protein
VGAYSVAQAKTQLSGLLQAAEAGENIIITRRGIAVATLTPVSQPKARVNWDRILAFQAKLAKSPSNLTTDVTQLLTQMRDE